MTKPFISHVACYAVLLQQKGNLYKWLVGGFRGGGRKKAEEEEEKGREVKKKV